MADMAHPMAVIKVRASRWQREPLWSICWWRTVEAERERPSHTHSSTFTTHNADILASRMKEHKVEENVVVMENICF